MKVRWTGPAAEHWEQAFNYIADSHPAAAERIATQIIEIAEMLAVHPHLGKVGRLPNTREFVITNTHFVLVYGVDSVNDALWIYAVYHASRRWPKYF
jgi:toxin ParE1/3/4